jgi:hypothetical protein
MYYGEPQLAFSNSQSSPPYGPLVGAWRPQSLHSYAPGEYYPRVRVDSNGITLSGGTDTGDVELSRYASGVLRIRTSYGTADEGLQIGDDAVLFDVDTVDRLGIKGVQTAANGGFVFGSGKDTNLYRAQADVLKTDDTLFVGSSTPTNLRGVILMPFVFTGTLPGTGTQDIYHTDQASNIVQIRLPFPCEVVGISVVLASARTAGTLSAQAYNNSDTTLTGPAALIDGTTTNLKYITDTVTGTPDLTSGQQIRVRLTTSGFTPVANSVVVHVYLSMYAE